MEVELVLLEYYFKEFSLLSYFQIVIKFSIHTGQVDTCM